MWKHICSRCDYRTINDYIGGTPEMDSTEERFVYTKIRNDCGGFNGNIIAEVISPCSIERE